LAGELLFDEKIRQSAAPFWFGLRNFAILQIFYSQAFLQRIIFESAAFLEPGLAIATRLPKKKEDYMYFCMKRLSTSKSFQIFKIRNENIQNL
jgi:hypothetical protein